MGVVLVVVEVIMMRLFVVRLIVVVVIGYRALRSLKFLVVVFYFCLKRSKSCSLVRQKGV